MTAYLLMKKGETRTRRTGPSPSAANVPGISLPIWNSPPSNRTISVRDPVLVRIRCSDWIRDWFSRASQIRSGTQHRCGRSTSSDIGVSKSQLWTSRISAASRKRIVSNRNASCSCTRSTLPSLVSEHLRNPWNRLGGGREETRYDSPSRFEKSRFSRLDSAQK